MYFQVLKCNQLMNGNEMTKRLQFNWHQARKAQIFSMTLILRYCRAWSKNQKTDSQRAGIERWLQNSELDFHTVRWFEDKAQAPW